MTPEIPFTRFGALQEQDGTEVLGFADVPVSIPARSSTSDDRGGAHASYEVLAPTWTIEELRENRRLLIDGILYRITDVEQFGVVPHVRLDCRKLGTRTRT